MLRELIKEEIRRLINDTEDSIPGGLADGKTLEDIASRHDIKMEVLTPQLAKGIKVELEHTTDTSIAKEIAMDHLMEDPMYYEKLPEHN